MSITNGGERTASELVRVEISELKDYADELTAEVGQEVRTLQWASYIHVQYEVLICVLQLCTR